MAVIEAIVRVRRGTAATAAANNPILKLGEVGFETDTRRFKVGDGTTAWNSLLYAAGSDLGDALEAISALTPAADRLAYFTGASTASLTVLTAFARTILDDTNAAGVRGTISAAASGANGDITSLTGLTTPLSFAQGGTGGSTTGSGSTFVLSASPNLSEVSLRQTYPTLYFRDGSGTRLGYFQHDADNMNIVVDVGDMVLGATVRSYADGVHNLGSAAKRYNTVYATTGAINTSDARAKEEISAIPDEWLDAWADVEWCRYRFTDGSRWHTGLIAQRVRDAFARRGLDATEIGLLCYDKWPAIRARKERLNAKGEVIQLARDASPAGDRWGLRYDECDAMEHALNRRNRARMAAEMAELRELVEALKSGK